jgi:hypothetical protein
VVDKSQRKIQDMRSKDQPRYYNSSVDNSAATMVAVLVCGSFSLCETHKTISDVTRQSKKKKLRYLFLNAAASLPPFACGFESTCAFGAMHRGMERDGTMWLINRRCVAE